MTRFDLSSILSDPWHSGLLGSAGVYPSCQEETQHPEEVASSSKDHTHHFKVPVHLTCMFWTVGGSQGTRRKLTQTHEHPAQKGPRPGIEPATFFLSGHSGSLGSARAKGRVRWQRSSPMIVLWLTLGKCWLPNVLFGMSLKTYYFGVNTIYFIVIYLLFTKMHAWKWKKP